MDGGKLMDSGKLIIQASLFEILALALLYPTDVLVDALTSGEYAEALAEITGELDMHSTELAAALDELTVYAGRDSEEVLHELRAEHTRLFIGAPEPVVSPFAGVWQAKRDGVQPLLFVNKESMAVERFMRSCGVGQPDGTNEPLDHIGSELEFLQYLALIKAEAAVPPADVEIAADAYGQFYATHFVTWVPEFADAIIEESENAFFLAIAQVIARAAKCDVQ